MNEHACVESERVYLGTGATCSYFLWVFKCFKSFTTEQDTTLLVGLNNCVVIVRGQLSCPYVVYSQRTTEWWQQDFG